MLTLELGKQELFNEETNEFIQSEGTRFRFEHSLSAISKWESKYRVPFLQNGEKTPEQTLYYIECMCLDEGFSSNLLDNNAIEQVNKYITENHTATTIANTGGPNNKVITSEVLYSYLSICDIPFDTDTWNLDRLLMVIGSVSAIKSPPKKMTKAEIYEQNERLNEQRKAELNIKG